MIHDARHAPDLMLKKSSADQALRKVAIAVMSKDMKQEETKPKTAGAKRADMGT